MMSLTGTVAVWSLVGHSRLEVSRSRTQKQTVARLGLLVTVAQPEEASSAIIKPPKNPNLMRSGQLSSVETTPGSRRDTVIPPLVPQRLSDVDIVSEQDTSCQSLRRPTRTVVHLCDSTVGPDEGGSGPGWHHLLPLVTSSSNGTPVTSGTDSFPAVWPLEEV